MAKLECADSSAENPGRETVRGQTYHTYPCTLLALCGVLPATWVKLLLAPYKMSLTTNMSALCTIEGGCYFTDVMHNVTIGYDKTIWPSFGVPPTTVGVSMYILSVDELNQNANDFRLKKITFHYMPASPGL